MSAGTADSASGRVAVVTGGAAGMGRAMTSALLDAGHAIVAVDRDASALDALHAASASPALLTVAVDLADDGAADAVAAAAHDRFGRVDILVNNAGIGQSVIRPDWDDPIRFWEVTNDQWRLYLAIHAVAPLALARTFAPEMMERGWGRIVNVTTSLGTMIGATSPTYGPSKAALEAMSAIMAKNLADTGVTVNVLVPGGVTNTALVPLEAGYDRSEMIQPDVMAAPLLWLVSDAARPVTGRRFIAAEWDETLPPEEAAARAGAPVAWTSIATSAITPPRRARA